MLRVYIFIFAFILDILLGDPPKFPHPVRWIGRFIEFLNKHLFIKSTRRREFINGIFLFFITIGIVGISIYTISKFSLIVHKALYFVINTYLFFTALALKDLKDATLKIYKALKSKDIKLARYHLSQVVGRDTENLSEEEIVRATIETIAEGYADGVVAPIFYFLLGGNIFAWIYKTVNTLDSMVGYKFYPYTYYGKVSAKMDDLLNWIPSRIAALSMLLYAFISRKNVRKAYHTFKRDRKNHPSPNGGNPESVMAGILGVRLGGINYYKGHKSIRGFIGDMDRPLSIDLIPMAINIIYNATFLIIFIGGTILWMLIRY